MLASQLTAVRIDIAASKSEDAELVDEQLEEVEPTDWMVTETAMSCSSWTSSAVLGAYLGVSRLRRKADGSTLSASYDIGFAEVVWL